MKKRKLTDLFKLKREKNSTEKIGFFSLFKRKKPAEKTPKKADATKTKKSLYEIIEHYEDETKQRKGFTAE